MNRQIAPQIRGEINQIGLRLGRANARQDYERRLAAAVDHYGR